MSEQENGSPSNESGRLRKKIFTTAQNALTAFPPPSKDSGRPQTLEQQLRQAGMLTAESSITLAQQNQASKENKRKRQVQGELEHILSHFEAEKAEAEEKYRLLMESGDTDAAESFMAEWQDIHRRIFQGHANGSTNTEERKSFENIVNQLSKKNPK